MVAVSERQKSYLRLFERYQQTTAAAVPQVPTLDNRPVHRDDITRFLASLDQKVPVVSLQTSADQSALSYSEDSASILAHYTALHDALLYRPKIIPLLAVIETPQSFIFLHEYVGHTLRDILVHSPDVLSEGFAKPLFILYQVITSLQFLHQRGIVHADVNSTNVLLEPDLYVWLRGMRERSHDTPCLRLASSPSLAPSPLAHLMSSPQISLREAITRW